MLKLVILIFINYFISFLKIGFVIKICSSQNLFLGTDEVSNNDSKISLFPNPVKDFITIDSKTIIDTITIYDVNGRQIKTIDKISDKIDVSSIDAT